MKVRMLLFTILTITLAGAVRADSIAMSGTLTLPDQNSLAYSFVVNTSFLHWTGAADGKHYTSLIADLLSYQSFTYDASGVLIGTANVSYTVFNQLVHDPPWPMQTFAQFIPGCTSPNFD